MNQYPTPPQRPRKSHTVRNVLLGLLGAAVLLFGGCAAIVIGTSGASNTTGAQSGSGPKDSDTPKAATVGQKVKDGKFTFTVTKVRDGVDQIGPSGFGEKAQGQFVLVNVTVTNHGDEAQTLDDGDQYLFSTSGKKFNVDTMAGASLEGNDVFLNDINPGNTVKGVFVFDVPQHFKGDHIELHDSPFSDGVSVKL